MSDGRRFIAVGIVALGAIPVLLAPVATGLVEGSVAAAVGGATKAAILFLPALLLGAAFLPLVIDPATEGGRRLRTFGPVLLLVFVQGMWWIFTAPPLPGASRERAARAFATNDLRNLASQQEIHFADWGAYSADLDSLGFVASVGTVLRFEAVPTGWAASVEAVTDPDFSCAMYYGDGLAPLPTNEGHVPAGPGLLLCEPLPPLSAWGPVGRFLRAYHGALERRLISF